MRRRRREIDVFSMSALDLFASGMGAFIILAVVAMPFFPKTGDSEAQIEELQARLEEASQRARDLEAALATARTKDGSLAAQLAEANARSRQLEEMLAKVQGQDADLQARLDEANQRSRDLEAALASTQGQDAGLRELLEQARQRARDLEAALAKSKARDADLQARLDEALADSLMQDLDLVLCLDVTGSMTDQIDGLKREIGVLAQILDRLSPSASVGVVAFGDRMWYQPIHAHGLVETTNLGSLLAFVNSLAPNMRDPRFKLNNDGPEALTAALEHAVASEWRTGSNRQFIVVITDNAAYPERRSTALQYAQHFSSQTGRHVSTVRANFTENRRDRQAADTFLRQLAEAGRGQFVDAAGGESMIGSLLLAILDI